MDQNIGRARAILALLEAVEHEETQSQRTMATRFGVALGLVNAYLKVCVKKGYVKVKRLPSRRYAYMLTPKGLAEKVRLTLMLLSDELGRFRRARNDYALVFQEARSRGWQRLVLVGLSELAEISAICALEAEIEVVAIVDANTSAGRFIGLPLLQRLADVPVPFDGAIITDMRDLHHAYEVAIAELGSYKVLAPAFLGFPLSETRAA